MSKRDKTKYPALKKGLNVRSRKDVIEVDYVNGVYDQNGKQVIRALNEEEKAWLNQFYEETVVTNFSHGEGMKDVAEVIKKIEQCDEFKKLKKQQKESTTYQERARIKELKKLLKAQNRDDNAEEIENLETELQDLRDKYLFYPNKEDHKRFYNENNRRNIDLFNKCFIEEFTEENVDHYMMQALETIDFELLMIEEIEKEGE